MVRSGEAERVGGIGEVLQPPGEHSSEEEGERGSDGSSNKLRIVMVVMEVGGEKMDEGEGAEVEQDNM